MTSLIRSTTYFILIKTYISGNLLFSISGKKIQYLLFKCKFFLIHFYEIYSKDFFGLLIFIMIDYVQSKLLILTDLTINFWPNFYLY